MYNFKKIKALMLTVFMSLGTTLVHALPSAIMSPGDAAVTGFSGTVNQTNNKIIFDKNGPSVRIINIKSSGAFELKNTLKPFTWTPSNVGQVFGITLDNSPHPNVFVAATSAYGLAIYKANAGRLKHGAPGAQFMPGQFGPQEQGGGSGSIWRIDGTSGKVTLFANVIYNGIENTPASLGGLAFDPVTSQIFVADRTTGMIHRFAPDGTDKGVFDHGVQGLPAIGQPPEPFDASTLANIKNANFDTEKPQTWGYAPPARRVFALAVHGQRLYYSIYGPQIWSVGIAADGSFTNDARFEVDSPALQEDIEISSITFDELGYMYIAERGAPTGDYNFISVANSGQNRVKRFAPRQPNDTSSAFWVTPGDEYAVGMLPEYQNSDGGVALTCGRTIWTTGDHLLDIKLSEATPHIDGLQGNDKALVKPANMPPKQSWFINYYDNQANPNSSGHMGALVIWTVCSGYTVPVVPIGFSCPKGSYLVDGLCLIPPNCPVGTLFENGYCIYPNCPWGYVRIDGECVNPPRFCDIDTVFFNGSCVPINCPPELERTTYGYCHCPHNLSYFEGRCQPPTPCPPNLIYIDGRCIPPTACPPNLIYQNGRCIPPTPCPPNLIFRNGHCVPPTTCPPNLTYINGLCTPPTPCPPNLLFRNGHCGPPTTCPHHQIFKNGHCVPPTPCPHNQILQNGHCVPTKPCPHNQIFQNGHCVPTKSCPHNQIFQNGHCVPPTPCLHNQIFKNGRCVIPLTCPPNQISINGHCATPTTCPPNKISINGHCTTPMTCPHNQIFKNGHCMTPSKCLPNQIFKNGHCMLPSRCPSNQIERNGKCVMQQHCINGTVLKNGHCIPTYTNKLCPRGQILIKGRCTTHSQTKPMCRKGQVYRRGQCVSNSNPKNNAQHQRPIHPIKPNTYKNPNYPKQLHHQMQPKLHEPHYPKPLHHQMRPNLHEPHYPKPLHHQMRPNLHEPHYPKQVHPQMQPKQHEPHYPKPLQHQMRPNLHDP
jgi:hypothetical protein